MIALKHYDESNYPGTANTIHYAQAELTQSAGILLRLPQEVIAQAIVLLQRFTVMNASTDASEISAKDASAASLYLTAKLSFTPVSPRSLLTVYHYLQSPSSPLVLLNPPTNSMTSGSDPSIHHLSEGNYEASRNRLYLHESIILKALAFDTHVALPHPLALTYLSVLGLQTNTELTIRVLAHLNTGLLSPQFLYLTHQPNALAVAAIYLAAKEVEVKLVDGNWWEVFDVDREDLGFLVVSLQGIPSFVKEDIMHHWKGKTVPLG
ncbi:putative cyclin domain protein [Phaeomoniella chlamydospora]|uniref:Putative cyclin domain protein n=1 Tax=Phaeomoniella chlamydospora TaxID=158046 RepID=A0A0G2GHV9_PHACM|nr:putative cyclin domain protein [Phaeomoniella chlamydospora]